MLTRRDFIVELAVSSAAIGAATGPFSANIFAAAPAAAPTAIVSIHMDQPYIDTTGRALPYLPPGGVRAGASAAYLSETEFRRRYVYL
jgi:hypothetical protein